MAFQKKDEGFQKRMYPVDCVCSKCGTQITELPFEPNPDLLNKLLCRECHANRAKSSFEPSQRRMYPVDCVCSKCGAQITELPFEPNPDLLNKLLCRKCHEERSRSFRT